MAGGSLNLLILKKNFYFPGNTGPEAGVLFDDPQMAAVPFGFAGLAGTGNRFQRMFLQNLAGWSGARRGVLRAAPVNILRNAGFPDLTFLCVRLDRKSVV